MKIKNAFFKVFSESFRCLCIVFTSLKWFITMRYFSLDNEGKATNLNITFKSTCILNENIDKVFNYNSHWSALFACDVATIKLWTYKTKDDRPVLLDYNILNNKSIDILVLMIFIYIEFFHCSHFSSLMWKRRYNC